MNVVHYALNYKRSWCVLKLTLPFEETFDVDALRLQKFMPKWASKCHQDKIYERIINLFQMSHFYTRGCNILSNIAYYQHQKVAISILFIVFMDGTQLNSFLNSSFEKKIIATLSIWDWCKCASYDSAVIMNSWTYIHIAHHTTITDYKIAS